MPTPLDDVRSQLDANEQEPVQPAPQPYQQLSSLGGFGAAAPQPVAEDPYADIRKQLDETPDAPPQQDPTVGMRAAAQASRQYTPAKAAQVARLSNQTGYDPSVVTSAYDDLHQAHAALRADYPSIAANHKMLSQWLMDPVHAAIAKDDLPGLRGVSAATQVLTAQDFAKDDPMPWIGGIGASLRKSVYKFDSMLLAGPAWLQKEYKQVTGDTDPAESGPLGMLYRATDLSNEIDRVRSTYAPDVMKDFVGNVAGMAVDPTNVVLPAKGAQLAIRGTQVLDEALQATKAIKGAAAIQGELAGAQTARDQGVAQQKEPSQEAHALGDTANTAVQAALGYFFGKAGGLIPILRATHAAPFTEAPLNEFVQDIVLQGVIGGNQSLAGTTAEAAITRGELPSGGEALQSAATGAVTGSLMAAGNLHEAILQQHHLTSLRNAAGLQFANKMADAFQQVAGSQSAQRSPEEVGKLIDAIAAQGSQNVYLQAEEFQKQVIAQGLDPAIEADRAGLGEEYRQAQAIGGDMQMPIRAALALGAGSKEPAALAAKFRQAPNAPNAIEAATFFQGSQEDLAANLKLAGEQIEAGRGAGDISGQTIFDETKAKFLAAGRTAQEATDLGKLYQRFFAIQADKFNAEGKAVGRKEVSATDLYDQARLRVQGVLPQVISHIAELGHLDRTLDRLRTDGPKTPEDAVARTALKDLGLDPTEHTNEQIKAQITAKTDEMATSAKLEQPHVVQGRRVVVTDVPYAGGTSADGKTVYIDRRIPRFIEIDGKRIDVHQLIAEHEIREKADMDSGRGYAESHADALKTENEDAAKQAGIKPEDYEKAVKPYIDQARKDFDPAKVPTDLERKPYRDMAEEHLLEKAAQDPTQLLHGDKPIVLDQGERLIPKDESLLRTDLMAQWKKAHGDRTPDKSSAEWQKMEAEAAKVDRTRGITEHLEPDLSHLTLEAADYVRGLSPEIRTALRPSIDYLSEHPDPKGELGNLKMIASSMQRRGVTFDQPARGAFVASKGLDYVIKLFQSADRSTAFHESAHYFLEVLGDLQSRADAPAAIKDDFARIMEWSGYGSREQMLASQKELAELQDKKTPTDADTARMRELVKPHETFARGFEAYLMEGKAPAIGLRRAFARIKGWMKSVYQDIKNLGVDLNPEIRSVFDRLLASDKEIAAAKARVSDELTFQTAESGAFTPEEFASYQRLAADADQAEADTLERSLMSVERKALSEAYAADRITMREQVSDKLAQEPVYQALEALQNSKTWDGRDLATPIKLSKEDLEHRLTDEERAQLPGPGTDKNKGRTIYTTKEDGITADQAAPLFGFATGDELLSALRKAADQERLTDQMTDAAMQAKYPDPMQDQALMDEEANKALHAPNVRGKLMDLERKALVRLTQKEKQKVMDLRDERQAMRVAARQLIGRTKLTAFDPERFVAAERTNAINLRGAMATKDYAAALRFKRAQMMNSELARAAYDAHEQASKDREALQRAAKDKRWRKEIGKAGGWEWTVTYKDGTSKVFDAATPEGKSAQEQARAEAQEKGGTYEQTSGYLEQIDSILEKYDLKNRAAWEIRNRINLQQFLDKEYYTTLPDGTRERNGLYANIPESMLVEASRPNLQQLTVNDLHDVRKAVESLAMMAKFKNTLLTSKDKLVLQQSVAEMVKGMTEHAFKHPKNPDGTTGLTKQTRNTFSNLSDVLVQIPRIAWEMDGYKNAGPVQRLYIHPQAEAADRKLEILHNLHERVYAANKAWGKQHAFGTSISRKIAGVDRSMSYMDRIVTLMHYGNPEGRQRLLDLNGWNDEIVHRIIGDLDTKDIAYANAMVDILGSHWSDIKAMEERHNGVAPPKVEAIPVQLAAGTYKGGYQRIYYDGNTASTLEHMVDQAISGEGLQRAISTAKGFTKARADQVKDKVLSLDAANWERSINEMAHDLTHRDLVINQLKMLANKDFRDAIIKTQGAGVYQQFINQTKGLAGGEKISVTAYEKAMENLRISVNYSHRAFNPIFAVAHFSGLVNALARVSPYHVGSAMVQMHLAGPWSSTAKMIKDKSTTMRYRNETRNNIVSSSPWASTTRKFLDHVGMAMVVKVWEHLDNVTWKGAYDQHMLASNNDERESVRVADQIVESSFGSDKQKDKAEIMRTGGPLMKIFTSSMQYDSALLNSIVASGNRVRYGIAKGSVQDIVKGLGSAFVLSVASTMLWDLIYDSMKQKDLDDWHGKGLAEKIATAPVATMMRTIPVMREIVPNLMEGNTHEGIIGASWLSNLQQASDYVHHEHKTVEGSAKAFGKVASDFLPIPTSQIFRIWDGVKYNQQHRADLLHQIWNVSNGPPEKVKH